MRTLWGDARVLTPHADGGSLRAWSLLELLRDAGQAVAFCPLFPGTFPPYQDDLPRDEARMQAAGFTVVHDIEAVTAVDQIVLSGPSVGIRFLDRCRHRFPAARLIYDTIDLHHVRLAREARLSSNGPHALRAIRMKAYERRLCHAADAVWVVSDAERRTVIEDFVIAPDKVTVVPNVHRAIASAPAFGVRDGLVFVGSFMHPPNVDAVVWFAADVLPGLCEAIPGLVFHVVGPHAPSEILRLQGERVRVHGFVPDLEDFFGQRRVNVAPLRAGAGIKGKVLYALGCGVPTVGTRVGLEGMAQHPGAGMTVAATPASWLDAVSQYYRDPDLWTRASTGGREFVQQHYSPARVREILQAAGVLA